MNSNSKWIDIVRSKDRIFDTRKIQLALHKGRIKREILLFVYLAIYGISLRFFSISKAFETNWDESTFLIVAQRFFRHGELPYTTTFEVKPPFAYLFYSPFSILRVESLWIYRLGCTVILVICAYMLTTFTVFQGRILHRVLVGFFFIALYSFLPGGLIWMTELNTILPLILIYRCYCNRNSTSNPLVLGVLVGILILTRSNMLFVLFAIISNPSNGKSSLNTKIKIALGTSLPFITVSLLYGVSGKLLELWKGMYLLPKYLFQSVNLLDFQVGITSTLLICGSIIPLLYTLIIPGSLFSQEERAHIQKVLILHICVILGVFISRPMYGHHLLQLTFLPLISFGVCLKNQLNQQHFLRRFLIVNRKAITFSLFLILGMFVFRNLAASDQLDAKFQASNNLVKEVSNVSTRVGAQTVWSPNASYIYYRLDLKPSSPITVHPVGLVTTAIRKAYLGANSNFTITFKKVIDSEPDVVVLNRHETYFSDSELNRIENWLKRKYSLVRTCPSGFQIYKVKSE